MTDHMDKEFLDSLEQGSLRVATREDAEWSVNTDIKQRILDLFQHSKIVDMPGGFRDKELFTPRSFHADDHIRMVPGGSSVRAGAYVGKQVVIMPPSYVNIGAYVDDDTMIDSHVLIGSCAQIGKRVHLSAGVQIGGVLEPIGQHPVIIEDDCFIGAGAVIVEGVWVRAHAVIAPGVVLSRSIPIYDLVHEKTYKSEIPPNAVVVPGTRPVSHSTWATKNGLHLGCALIVKYRDEKTEASLELESLLRS